LLTSAWFCRREYRGDPEQEYFADDVTESLTTRLSGAFVLARNTAFAYKGKTADVKKIGRDLIVSRLANRLGQELARAETARAERSANRDSMDHFFPRASVNTGSTGSWTKPILTSTAPSI
jgi:hypothetical protein